MTRSKNAEYVKAYQAREKAKRDAMGVVDVVIPLPASISNMAKEVCKRDGFENMTEMLLTLIRNAHAGTPVAIPPSGFVPKQKHLAKIGKPQSCSVCKAVGETCIECEGVES
jgi:hypothetical protein